MSTYFRPLRCCWLLLLPLTVTEGAVSLGSFVHASTIAARLRVRKRSCHSWGVTEGPQHQWRCRCAVETATEYPGEATHNGVSETKLEELERWLDKIGVDRGGDERGPAVRLKSFAERGVGLEATAELERDSTVASIPRKLCLSSDAGDAPPGTLRAWAHALLASVPASAASVPRTRWGEDLSFERDVAVVTLQLFLECVAGARSELAPWIAMLPQKGELTLPALWPPHDLEPLKGTLVMREIDNCLARVAAERNLIEAAIARGVERGEWGKGTDTTVGEPPGLENVKLKGQPTQAEWLRLRCIVQSRAYRMGNRYLLIPLVDFANHDDDIGFAVCPGDGVFTGLDEVVFSADRGYRPGQEVCTTYGDMDNAKRLFSFGFVTLHRPEKMGSSFVHDALSLPTEAFCDIVFPLDAADPLRNFKESVLRQHLRQNEDDAPRLEAVFPLTPRRPLVSQLVNGPARSFLESSMPLLRLVALTPEEISREVLSDACQFRQDSPKTYTSDVAAHSINSIQECGCIPTEETQACDPPEQHPVLADGEGEKILAWLAKSVSPENEREARRCLARQCSANLQATRLHPSDVESLTEAAREGLDMQSPKFTVTRPRRLLCAAVRVGEAIASYALLEACACTDDSIVDTENEGKTWFSWVLDQSISVDPLEATWLLS